MTTVISVNTTSKILTTSIGEIRYDYLVMATGSTNNFFGMTGLAAKAMPMKTLTDALDLRSLLCKIWNIPLCPELIATNI